MPRFARKARRLLAVSEYTRQDVIQQFGISPDNISVCYNGQTGSFKPSEPDAVWALRQRLGLAQPYFLYAGAIHPRKNIGNLLRAFDLFKSRTGLPHLLVLTGRMAWKTQSDLEVYQALNHRAAVHFTGRLDDPDLNTLYGGALALCYVSRFEGFGLPILEAFQAETAVITSRVSSMPEVAGDSALLVDPLNPESIAEALEALATQPQLRYALIERGRLQRERFSWARTAQLVWHALEAATS
jgi:glycosyltransferase involved in cell wall biosynthesis